MPPVQIHPYDASWPAYFTLIAHQLRHVLLQAAIPADAFSIHHIGSTSIRGLAAKPNIDIVILVPDTPATAVLVRDALIWEPPGSEYYRCIGNGGIRGRMSMKFADASRMPWRSVYIIAEDDVEGMLGWKGYRDVQRVLRADGVLRREYESVKWMVVRDQGVVDGVAYGRAKNEVVAKILSQAGWSEDEVSRKEALDVRIPGELDEGLPY